MLFRPSETIMSYLRGLSDVEAKSHLLSYLNVFLSQSEAENFMNENGGEAYFISNIPCEHCNCINIEQDDSDSITYVTIGEKDASKHI